MSQASALPRPGPRWGPYPERSTDALLHREGPLWQHAPLRLARFLAAMAPAPMRHTWLKFAAPWLKAVHEQQRRWQHAGGIAEGLTQARQALRQHGFTQDTVAAALGPISAAMEQSLGKQLSEQQWLAAAMLLDQTLVELPTGEGKTLALVAAASVAALAGVPTHVITANDYLAERDALAHAALWQLLGLKVGHTSPMQSPTQRRQIYAQDIVYTTAKEVAFDHLRDHLGTPPGQKLVPDPVLRGLNLALLDEADSILLDEAVVPLVISNLSTQAPSDLAARRALWWQAWQLAGALQWGVHAQVGAGGKTAQLTPSGIERLSQCCASLSGTWQRPQLRQALLEVALTAMHMLQLDRDYLIQAQGISLLDELTGRIAQGRVWSQGLQALVEIKEGLPMSAPADTVARTTFQRFFRQYWRLGGLSGTLLESRQELAAVYGLPVMALPPRRRSSMQTMAPRVFKTPQARWQAAVQVARDLSVQGRPVLIGTDSVAESEALSSAMAEAAVEHTVLNARHDRREAAIVAQAGRAGAITIATRMAGRGTDILLDARALAAGGLHVIHCQRNESGRLDRQLLGRAARQGQPGSSETWLCARISHDQPETGGTNLYQCSSSAHTPLYALCFSWISARLALWQAKWQQWIAQQRQSLMRKQLQEQDRQWEKRLHGPRLRR